MSIREKIREAGGQVHVTHHPDKGWAFMITYGHAVARDQVTIEQADMVLGGIDALLEVKLESLWVDLMEMVRQAIAKRKSMEN